MRPSISAGQPGATTSFGATGATPSFGQTGTTTFGSTGVPPSFGQTGTTTSFGATGATPSFGQPAFGQRTSISASPSLGQPQTFGQPATISMQSSLGQPSSISGQTFGRPSITAQTSTIGQPTFSTTQQTFGQPQTTFGRPSVTTETLRQPSVQPAITETISQPRVIQEPYVQQQPSVIREERIVEQPQVIREEHVQAPMVQAPPPVVQEQVFTPPPPVVERVEQAPPPPPPVVQEQVFTPPPPVVEQAPPPPPPQPQPVYTPPPQPVVERAVVEPPPPVVRGPPSVTTTTRRIRRKEPSVQKRTITETKTITDTRYLPKVMDEDRMIFTDVPRQSAREMFMDTNLAINLSALILILLALGLACGGIPTPYAQQPGTFAFRYGVMNDINNPLVLNATRQVDYYQLHRQRDNKVYMYKDSWVAAPDYQWMNAFPRVRPFVKDTSQFTGLCKAIAHFSRAALALTIVAIFFLFCAGVNMILAIDALALVPVYTPLACTVMGFIFLVPTFSLELVAWRQHNCDDGYGYRAPSLSSLYFKVGPSIGLLASACAVAFVASALLAYRATRPSDYSGPALTTQEEELLYENAENTRKPVEPSYQYQNL